MLSAYSKGLKRRQLCHRVQHSKVCVGGEKKLRSAGIAKLALDTNSPGTRHDLPTVNFFCQ